MVVYLNHYLSPSFLHEYISKDFESIWVNLELPDKVQMKDKLEKPEMKFGVLREPPEDAGIFYNYLAKTIIKGKWIVVLVQKFNFLLWNFA